MSERITIRFRLGKEDVEASLKLARKRQLLPWLMYASGLFLFFASYKVAFARGLYIAGIPFSVGLVCFALPSLLLYAQSKQTLEILKASPETELEFTPDGVKTRDGAENVLRWSSVLLEENAQVLHLLNQQRVVLAIIPKRAFPLSADLASVRNWGSQYSAGSVR